MIAGQEDKPEENEKHKPFQYFKNEHQGPTSHHFYLSEEIGDPNTYIEMIHRIKSAREDDVIYIYLNTPGGRLDTGIQILTAMRNTAAHVVTVLEGEVCSMGTFIFLSGDEFVVNDFSMFMIHNFSTGTFGKGHEVGAYIESITIEFSKMARQVYAGFLTEEELDRVIKGEDFWMGADDVRKRLTRMIKLMQKKVKEEEKAEKAREKQTLKRS